MRDYWAGSAHHVDTLNKGMIRVLGGKERDSMTFYHTTQNGKQFKTQELFISGVFHSIFLDHDCLQEIETSENKTSGKGGIWYHEDRCPEPSGGTSGNWRPRCGRLATQVCHVPGM